MSDELTYRPDAAGQDPALPGVFVVLEGADGGGKTTQARLLAERLEAAGADVVLTREPGGTQIGEGIRALVLEHGRGEVDARTEALLYAASRAAHAEQTIRPALARGAVVICDRYIDSSIAYQGAGRELGEHSIAELSRWAVRDLLPDLTLFLELPDDDARARLSERAAGLDRLESAPDSFRARTREAFRELAARGGSRRRVDASGTVEQVAARIDAELADRLPRLASLLEPGSRTEQSGRGCGAVASEEAAS